MTDDIIIEKRYKKTMDNILRKRKKKRNNLTDDQKCRYLVHEILNPLSIINNCVDLMIYKLNEKHDDREKCNFIDNSNTDSDSGNNTDSSNDTDSLDSLANNEKNQMITLLSMIKNQVNKCSEVSHIIMNNNCDVTILNVNSMLLDYVTSYKNLYPNVSISLQSYLTNDYHIKSNNCKAYLKIIFDNMINNILKYNSSVSILANKTENDKILIMIGDNDIDTDKKYEPVCDNKKSHFVGLEIIDKFCSILNIDWTLIKNNNKYIYKLMLNV